MRINGWETAGRGTQDAETTYGFTTKAQSSQRTTQIILLPFFATFAALREMRLLPYLLSAFRFNEELMMVASTRRGQSYDLGIVTLSIITVVAAIFFWDAPFLLPVKTFVVFLHELSHGLAAILTGGSVEQLRLVEDEGGLAFTRGGNQVLIASAGYVGSALWGALLMRLAWQGPRVRQYAIQGIAAIFMAAVFLYVRDLYTLGVVAVFSAVLFLLGRFGDGRVHLAVLWLLGTFSALYAIVDIGTDVLAQGPFAGIAWLGGGDTFNDATILASITWIPAFVWGVLWSLLSIGIYVFNMYSLMIRRGR